MANKRNLDKEFHFQYDADRITKLYAKRYPKFLKINPNRGRIKKVEHRGTIQFIPQAEFELFGFTFFLNMFDFEFDDFYEAKLSFNSYLNLIPKETNQTTYISENIREKDG